MPEVANKLGRGGFSKKYFTGTASPFSGTLSSDRTLEVHQIQVKLSAAEVAASNFTLTTDEEGDGTVSAAYDTEIYSKDLNAFQNFTQTFNPPLRLIVGDVLNVAYANSSTRTYGITILHKEL